MQAGGRRGGPGGGSVVQWGLVWCGLVWCELAWRGAVWCGVVWRGVACALVWSARRAMQARRSTAQQLVLFTTAACHHHQRYYPPLSCSHTCLHRRTKEGAERGTQNELCTHAH